MTCHRCGCSLSDCRCQQDDAASVPRSGTAEATPGCCPTCKAFPSDCDDVWHLAGDDVRHAERLSRNDAQPQSIWAGQHQLFIAFESVSGVPAFVGLGRPDLEDRIAVDKRKHTDPVHGYPYDFNIAGPFVLRRSEPDADLLEEWERQYLWAIDKLRETLGIIRMWDMLNPADGPERTSDAPYFRRLIDDVLSVTVPHSERTGRPEAKPERAPVPCSCAPDDQDEWCPHHGRLDDLEVELRNRRAEQDGYEERLYSAAQDLLKMMWLYPGFNVKTRGPIGCLHDALRKLDPDRQERLENGEEPEDLCDPDPEDEPRTGRERAQPATGSRVQLQPLGLTPEILAEIERHAIARKETQDGSTDGREGGSEGSRGVDRPQEVAGRDDASGGRRGGTDGAVREAQRAGEASRSEHGGGDAERAGVARVQARPTDLTKCIGCGTGLLSHDWVSGEGPYCSRCAEARILHEATPPPLASPNASQEKETK